ncbi:energy-coupling factor transporter ATPase [Selenomonas ruminantium]|uniref:energy-coupling factor transporter ATPase n=1 Tax=Selenomonas ruminantium TaxID=971 RepID=UPI0004799227|nr:energy-coupling factor transporter ATPase [Selenomonas ruminantium]
MAFIEVNNLTHIYSQGTEQEFCALRDVSFKIEQGEFVAILGANGSGKSTLARHLNGLLLPTEGRCQIQNLDTRNPQDVWQIRRQVGMVFQNPDNQLIAGVVEDDVAFGPENLGMEPAKIRQQVTDSLKAVGMENFRKFAPHLLSGGQKQRVAIAGALAMNTNCLILDEATAMLDPQGRKEVMATVERLHQERELTLIVITHFMDEAAKADRVLVMEKGQLVQSGKPQEIFADAPRMHKLGLAVPLAVELAWQLRQGGLQLPHDILSADDLIAALEARYVH